MADPQTPTSSGPLGETSGIPGGVQAYSDYLKAQIAAQANATGLTQVAPNLGGAQGPAQRQLTQPGAQQNQRFGPGEGAARRREATTNLIKSAQGVANTFAQYAQQKQQREYEQTISKFTGAVQGINQAKSNIAQAQAALQANPNDAQAKALLEKSQGDLQVNQTNLNDLVHDKKHSKTITKAFGIDDKNADSPERAAAKAVLSKQMGVSDQAAGILSRLPQTQQLTPQAQAQEMARKAGVVGAPATQGQILTADQREKDRQQREAKVQADEEAKAAALQVRQASLGLDKDNHPLPIDQLPETQRAKVLEARSLEEYRSAQTSYTQAREKALTDPNNPGYRIAMLRAQGSMLGAQARMMGAVTGRMNYDMRALGTDEKGNKLPGTIDVGGQSIGTAIAPNLEKILVQKAAFTDIRGAMSNLEASALAMQQSGTPINDPKLVNFMLAKDQATLNSLLNSYVGHQLTPQQKDYVIAYHQGVENISALRSTLKSSTAQANIDRMIKTLPGPGTPDYGYAQGQLRAIAGQLNRLETGIPNLNIQSGAVTPQTSQAPKTGDKQVDNFLMNIH